MRILLTGLTLLLLLSAPSFAQNDADEKDIYENWFSVIEGANDRTGDQNIPIYDSIASGFLDLYRETGDSVYLNFAISEAGSALQNRIISGLSDRETAEHQRLLERIETYHLKSDDFRKREFSPSDIYLFFRADVLPEDAAIAKNLLDYWQKKIPVAFEQNTAKGALQTQAVIRGYDLLDEFRDVIEAGNHIVGREYFSPTDFTLSLYEIISYASRTLGYYNQALKINQVHLQPIAESLDNLDMLYTIKLDYAITLFRVGRVNAALQEYEEIYQNIEYLTDASYRSALFNNLAITYLNTGSFDRYVEFQLEAYTIAKEDNNYSQQLSILRNLFIFYRRQNVTELAYSYLHQALQLSEKKNLSSETASILLSLGIYFLEVENEPHTAKIHFERARTVAREANNFHHYFNSLIELGEVHFKLGETDTAEDYFFQAINLSENRNDNAGYIQAVMRLANIYTKTDRFELAATLSEPFNLDDFRQLQFNLQILAANTLLKVYLHDQDYDNAIRLSNEMISEISDWLKESMDHQTGHMRMDEEFSEAYRLHSQMMFDTGNYIQGLADVSEVRDLSRSGFYNNPLLKSQMLSETELIRDYNLSEQIQTLRQQYRTATENERVGIGNELLNAISERNTLQNRVVPGAPESDFKSEISSAQHTLEENEMIIFMSVFNDQIFRYAITKDNIDMKVFSDSDIPIQKVGYAADTIGYGTTDLEMLYEIYELFFQELFGEDHGYSHVYFVPDNHFYRLPLEILPVSKPNSPESYASAEYMLETVSVSYLNTITELNQTKTNRNSEFDIDISSFGINDFTSAGHPHLQNLPYSTIEIENSFKKLTHLDNKELFLNEESTKSNFRIAAGQSRILHLATHSQVNTDSPLFSTLYFHQEEDENANHADSDGFIQTYELFDMNLNADLVFLSSCESGAGGYLEGAGILGFSRAFEYAGAKSISLNLWPVGDQTAAQIVSTFYSGLNDGLNKAEALRQARLQYLNHTNSDPYLWGSMVIYGNIDSPFLDFPKSVLIQLFSGVVLAVGIFCFAVAGCRKYYSGL